MQSLLIYNTLGAEVATLINNELSAGNYEVEFDASNVASGVYFYRLTAGAFSETKRMMVVK
ncbi:MAG: T9SS type A sorting domain-containing protein [Ignavibacteria bacterium]|nr:T9SS type A sorting domain-containing protein [Ignavibacteria bacterium]